MQRNILYLLIQFMSSMDDISGEKNLVLQTVVSVV